MADEETTAEEAKPLTAAQVRALKFPDLSALYDNLKVKEAAIEAQTVPLREQRDALVREIEPKVLEIRALEKKFLAIERGDAHPEMPGELAQIKNQLGRLAIMMGGRAMSQPEPDASVSPQ